ncbi:DUF1048 domain-containing protein [Streptomyces lydicus]
MSLVVERPGRECLVEVEGRVGSAVQFSPAGLPLGRVAVACLDVGAGDGPGRQCLELIGTDVAAFCDDLIKDSPTYADAYQRSISADPGAAEG